MESFTDDQLTSLAQQWRTVARLLNAYQALHWAEFSVEQHLDMNACQNSLLNRANDLETGQTRAILNEALPAYDQIMRAVNKAANTLSNAKNLTVSLNIGAMTVALAAATARGHLKSIDIALRELAGLQAMEE